MEGVSTKVYKGVKGYWRRRRYQKLGSDSVRQKRPFWRIRLTPKIKIKLKLKYSPKKLLRKIRDGYVNMMLKMANSPMIAGGGAYGSYGGYGDGVASFGMRPVKEYDEKMVIEIYKALAMRQSQLVPIDESKVVVSSRVVVFDCWSTNAHG
ncbi:hypothetical protein Tco_1138248 [Tanacetum coccineum]